VTLVEPAADSFSKEDSPNGIAFVRFALASRAAMAAGMQFGSNVPETDFDCLRTQLSKS